LGIFSINAILGQIQVQVTKHFIDFVETNREKIVGSNPDVILTRQTCAALLEQRCTIKRYVSNIKM